MKKLLLILIFISAVSTLQSAELSIAGGAKLWYVSWDPFFKDLMTQKAFNSYTVLDSKFDMKSTIMGSPNISLLYGDLGFSTALSYGQFVCSGSSTFLASWDSYKLTHYQNFTMEVSRYDIDLSLSYRLISQLVAFAGYKIMLFDVNELSAERLSTNASIQDMDYSSMHIPAHMSGPAVGFGYKYGIGNFILGANCSFIYLTGTYGKISAKNYNNNDPINPEDEGLFSFDTKSPGVTFEPYIGLTAGDRAIMLLGFRYQHLKNTMTMNTTDPKNNNFGYDANGKPILDFDSTDTFLGVSLSISVIF